MNASRSAAMAPPRDLFGSLVSEHARTQIAAPEPVLAPITGLPSDRLEFPLHVGRGQNERQHWRSAWRNNSAEKEAVDLYLRIARLPKPATPCVVLLTRIGPSNGLDDDNLASGFKQVRDVVARWIGVNDKRSDVVRYKYAQERGKSWAVRIEFLPWSPAQ